MKFIAVSYPLNINDREIKIRLGVESRTILTIGCDYSDRGVAYTAMGDHANAAKYVATLRQIAPAGTQRFIDRNVEATTDAWPHSRILQQLRVALAAPQG